jgi:hypothetical protein
VNERCPGGYYYLLEALADPKNPEHEEQLKWIGGKFGPETFDAKKSTKSMRQGLPDWRTP